MARQCPACGTVYDNDDADFCNACGHDGLVPFGEPAPQPPHRDLRDDPYSLVAAAVLWLSGMLYIVGNRQPRSWTMLVFLWGVIAVAGIVAGLILRNTRPFVAFAGVGALFALLYGLIKLQ